LALSIRAGLSDHSITARANRAWQGKPDDRDWFSRGPRRQGRRKSDKPDAPRTIGTRSFSNDAADEDGPGYRSKDREPRGGQRRQKWWQRQSRSGFDFSLPSRFGEAGSEKRTLTGRRRWGNPNGAFLSSGASGPLRTSKKPPEGRRLKSVRGWPTEAGLA